MRRMLCIMSWFEGSSDPILFLTMEIGLIS